MVLLISYDLNQHERPRSYEQVRQLIEANAVSWQKPLYSQWLVETNEGADAWSARIRAVLDENDYLLVVQVRRPYQGWLPRGIWDWLNARM